MAMTVVSPCHGFINPRSTIRLQRHHPPITINKPPPPPPPPSPFSPSTTTLFLSLLPIIKPSNTWGNVAILTITASLSQTLAKTNRLSRLLGAPVTAMALSFGLASIGILPPGGSAASRQLQSISLNLATPLVLLGAELGGGGGSRRRRGGGEGTEARDDETTRTDARRTTNDDNNNASLLLSFVVASFGTLLAGIAATVILPSVRRCCRCSSTSSTTEEGLKIAAALVAKNIGGGINYVAVCDTLRASPEAIAAGLCVDNIFALIYFPVVSVLASGLPDVREEEEEVEVEEEVEEEIITVETLSAALALASLLTYLGIQLGGKYSASLPASTLLTLLFVLASPRLRPRLGCDKTVATNDLRPTARILGTTLLYLFFSTAGAPGLAVAPTVREAFVPLGSFLSVRYAGHGLVLWGWRRWGMWMMKRRRRRRRRRDDGKEMMDDDDEGAFAKQRLLVASSAAIGGPATATALAEVNGWKRLIVPSLIVGNVGYAVATFIGVGFYAVFRTRL